MRALHSALLLVLQIINTADLFHARLNPSLHALARTGIKRTILGAETKSTMPQN